MSKWKMLETTELAKLGPFRIRQDKCQLPDGRIMPKYYVVEFPDWVHVIAITPEGMMVLVDQYRHAAEGRFLELPGGTTEPHIGESNSAGALRELEEETGYSGKLKHIGSHYPNPALQDNKVHVFLSLDCSLQKQQKLDPFEDLDVVLKPVAEVYQLVEEGKVLHGLMLGALFLARPYLQDFL
ncbi:MAG TPA: NUDIX hydrolase [Halieaceae bacterium]|nr:NUDIX hydrolase [Halieaceae bacterium]